MTGRRSEWTRTLWGFLGLILVIGAAAAIWIHHVWSHSDQLLEQVVRSRLDQLAPGLRVSFRTCRFDLMRRVRIDDVAIATQDGREIAHVPSLVVSIDRQALAEHQQLVIQRVSIQDPQLTLSRDASGRWNWQDVVVPETAPSMLSAWTVENASINVTLAGQPGETTTSEIAGTTQRSSRDTRSLSQLNLQLVPAGQDRLLIDAQALLTPGSATETSRAKDPTKFSVSGHWQMNPQSFSLKGNIESLRVHDELRSFIQRLLVPEVEETAQRTDEQTAGRTAASPPAHLTWHGMEIDAIARIDFRFAKSDTEPDWDYKTLITLQQGSLASPTPTGTPGELMALEDVTGQVYLDPRHLQVKTLRGRLRDTQIQVDGLVALAGNTDARPNPGRIDLSVTGLRLDERLRQQLPPDWQTLFDMYDPVGIVDLSTTLRPRSDRDPVTSWQPTDSVLTARKCQVRHAKFPYPVQSLVGTLTQQGHAHDMLVHLDGTAGGRPIRFRGRVHNVGPTASSQIDISVDRFPLDKQLRQAVSPSVRRTLELLGLGGTADLRARLTRPPGAKQPLTTQISGRLVDAHTLYHSFRWPITDIQGEFQARVSPSSYSWQFSKLTARHQQAVLKGQGRLDGTPETPGHFELNIDAQNIPLDSGLREACSHELKQLWDRAGLAGRLDGRIEMRRDGRGPTRIELPRFTISNGTLLPSGFPYELTGVRATGHYAITDDHHRRLTVTTLSGQHLTTRVSAQAVLDVDQRRDWTLRLDPIRYEGLVADQHLKSALPGKLRDSLAHLDPRGAFHLGGLIELRGAGEPGFPITAAWNLKAELPNNRLRAGVQLDHVTGHITSRGKWFGKHAEMTGRIQLDSASVWGYAFQDISGPYQFQNQDLVIGSGQAFDTSRNRNRNFPDIPLDQRVTARAVGGLFTLDAQARIDEQSSYHVKMNMSEARLENFAKLYLKGRKKLKGLMRGWVDLRGAGDSPQTVSGRGQLQVSPAELYELPIVVQLFDVLSLGPPEQTAFRYAQCDFHIARSRFHFNSIDLVGNSLQLRGRGQASFAGQVGLDFYSMLPSSRIPIPFIQPLIAPLTTGWVAVRVDGKTNNPRAQIRPAPVLDDALRGFLGALNSPNRNRQPPPLNAPFGRTRRPRQTRRTPDAAPARSTRSAAGQDNSPRQ